MVGERTPVNCPLIRMWAPRHMCAHTNKQTNVMYVFQVIVLQKGTVRSIMNGEIVNISF